MAVPVLGFDPSTLSRTAVAESENGLALKFTLSDPNASWTLFHYSAEVRSADGTLLQWGSGSIQFNAGETTAFLPYPLTDDATSGNKTFRVIISAIPNRDATLDVSRSVYAGTIVDNDIGGFSATSSDGSAYLGMTRLQVVPKTLYSDLWKYLSELKHVQPNEFLAYTTRDMVQGLEKYAIATTAVAVTTYQFFTGATPTSAGLNFLVSAPDSTNANDLNDPYYQAFSLENRYINFASNLGLVGEGKAAFAGAYKDLSFADTVAAVYDKVIGRDAATAAGLNPAAAISDIASREWYFASVAHERMGGFDQDLAKKAGLVGYILAEGVKANVGLYARALENFYVDLTDSTAKFGVDLIGTYGPGTPMDLVT